MGDDQFRAQLWLHHLRALHRHTCLLVLLRVRVGEPRRGWGSVQGRVVLGDDVLVRRGCVDCCVYCVIGVVEAVAWKVVMPGVYLIVRSSACTPIRAYYPT